MQIRVIVARQPVLPSLPFCAPLVGVRPHVSHRVPVR